MKTTCGRLSNYQIRATAANRDSTQSSVGQERSRKLQPRVTVRLQKAALSSASGLLRQLRELPLPSLSVRTEVQQRFAFRLR